MASINFQNVQIKNGSSWYTMCPFPVGFVYCSTNNTSPATTYGGTWTALTGGRYLRANNAWGSGGSNTISVEQMPSHGHTTKVGVISTVSPGGYYYVTSGAEGASSTRVTLNIDSTGGGQAFYPTYQNVYCWYRTA